MSLSTIAKLKSRHSLKNKQK